MLVYRIDKDGKCITHSFSGRYNTEVWLDASVLARDEDGNTYDYYLSEPDEDGVYQPDTVAIAEAKDTEEAKEFKETQIALKLQGIEFEGTMCSATAEDMWGLTAIAIGIDKMGMEYSFKFDNGNTLAIGPDNYADFIAVWAPFRDSFF